MTSTEREMRSLRRSRLWRAATRHERVFWTDVLSWMLYRLDPGETTHIYDLVVKEVYAQRLRDMIPRPLP